MSERSPLLLVGLGTAGSAIARGVRRAYGGELRHVLADTDAATGEGGGPFVLLGGDRLAGRGTGGDFTAGRLAAESSLRAFDEHLDGVRLAVLVTALGGGTGSAAAIDVAKHLVAHGVTAVVFATTPFTFEGEDRQRNARGAAALLEAAASATFFLPLDKLVAETDNMAEAMRRAVDTVAGGVTLFWRLLAKPGYIRLDVEQLRHLLADAGRGRFATVTAQGPGRAAEAVDRLLRSDLLAAASGPVVAAVCGVLAGDDLLLSEVGRVADGVRGAFAGHAFALATVNDEETFSGRLSVAVLLFEKSARKAGAEAEAPVGDVMSPRRRRKGPLASGPVGRGRFQNAEPTVWHDEDLDVPTFMRKGLSLDF